MTKRKKPRKVKSRNRKLRTPKTTRSTAGPGFDFEDHVAAWLILKALTGQSLPIVEGTCTRLQMQTKSLGWHLDDILVTSVDSQGREHHLAVSCKSNIQVSSSGLPSDFMQNAWKQWSETDSGPMRRDGDGLLLAARGQHPQFHPTWSQIKIEASSSDSAMALARIRAPAKHRKIFDSVLEPAKAAGVTASDEDTLALIRRVGVVPLDFQLSHSGDEKTAIAQCRGLLAGSGRAEGAELWSALLAVARTARLGNGTVEIAALWRDLRAQFMLKDHPDYSASWDRLRALTNDYKATIETALPSGLAVARTDEASGILAMRTEAAFVVYGDSGTGKSALLKVAIEAQFPTTLQVWLGPDQLAAALSEAERGRLGLAHPLIDVLDASPNAQNILVIDAAERLSSECVRKAAALIVDLLARRGTEGKPGWRVVIVGQTEAWVSGQLQKLAGVELPPNFELKALSENEAREALLATTGVSWLASHDDAVAALTNLRALAWVVDAAPRFASQSGVGLSLTAIADRLWSHWTGDKPDAQRLLMRLSEREASFEHSFALSELDGPDAAAFGALPEQCPLRKNDRNRIHFQHDLAADWARFQRLKEIAHDTARWAAYAGNPLWNGALRMLGQLLLRERVGQRNAWDVAFEAAEKAKDEMPLAADVLLDALFLDPNAEVFLDARTDMLLENNGARLLRLLRRFEHVASVPGGVPEQLRSRRDLSLYVEAQYRTLIFGRWPAVARFLARHRDRIAALTSPVVAGVCERWLTSTPVALAKNVPMPFRREFAQLALATARELQYGHAVRIIYIGDFEGPIYRAALAAAPDLPAETSEWLLEMVRRREWSPDLVQRVRDHRAKEAEQHRERMKTDAGYRTRHERRMAGPTFIPSGRRKLPPWPLGPRGNVEGHLQKTLLHSNAAHTLMRVRPDIAAEVLLAAIIEGSPEEEYGRRIRFDPELGLDYDHEGYPTAYWKSPFFAFLLLSPDVARTALHQLVNFCTERWEHGATRDDGSRPPTISIPLEDGTVREFIGDYFVFTWSQSNGHHNGQLFSALAALEKWLCGLIDADVDITNHIDELLRNSNSVGVIGVLVNIGKYRPELLKGPLRSLLAVHHLYVWDYHRVKNSAEGLFDGMSWIREGGEAAFEMARDWTLAPHRRNTLEQIAIDLLNEDRPVADFVLAATRKWEAPDGQKADVEFKMLVAELDYRNYKVVRDPTTGEDKRVFSYPADVQAAIQGFEQDNAAARQTLALPDASSRILWSSGFLQPRQADMIAAALAAIDGNDVDLDDDMKQRARLGAAAALLVKATPEWLEENVLGLELNNCSAESRQS